MVDLLDKNIKEVMNSSYIKTFGFIMYNETNPNIVKLLRDNDYWNALSTASGESFIIFSIKPKEGSLGYPKMPKNTLGMMVPIWKEPKDNEELLEIFGVKSTKNLPLFFVFTKVGQELLTKSIEINDTSIDSALKELTTTFHKINDISKSINTEKHHEAYIHDQYSEILQKHNFSKAVTNIDYLFGKTKRWLGLF
jgi:hypothetical protein